MASKIFLNLAIKDLKKSIAFFKEPEFAFNSKFTDDYATCMNIAQNIFAKLVTMQPFKT